MLRLFFQMLSVYATRIFYEENVKKMPFISNITYTSRDCKNRTYFRGRSHVLYDPSNAFFEYMPLKFAKSFTWIEITHCAGVNIQEYEKEVYWAYITPGSGVFMYTGKTAIRRHHRFYYPLKEINYFKKMGFDTIQYTHPGDQPCGTNSIEIIDLKRSGSSVCHSMLRSGYNASEKCDCIHRKSRWAQDPISFPQNVGKKELAVLSKNVCVFYFLKF